MSEPLVGVVMGSTSDWETMRHCVAQLQALGVACESRVLSAHRTPGELDDWVRTAEERGIEVIVAGAGMAAALPGVVAAKTTLPVLGVPMETTVSGGLDSLLSMVQMPGGIPVGVLAIGKAGAVNAAILAAQILARSRPALRDALVRHRATQASTILASPDPSATPAPGSSAEG